MKINEKFVLVITSLVIVIAIVAIIFQFAMNGFIKRRVSVGDKNDKIEYVKTIISKNVLNYIQSQQDVEKDLNGRKIVVYYTGNDFKYAKELKNSIDEVIQNKLYSSVYVFHPEGDIEKKFFTNQEEAINYIEFKNTCQQFCIVNLEKKQILNIDNIDDIKSKEITQILEKFKDW